MEVYRTSTINGEFRFCLFLFIFGLEIWFCLIEGTCFDRFRTETTVWKLKGPCQISCFNTSCSEKSPFKWGIPVYTHDVFFLWIIPNKEGKQNTEPWTAGHCSFVTAMCMDGWLEEELKLVFKWISYIYIHHEISINKWLEDWPTKKWPKLPSKRWEILQISWKVLPIIVQAPAGCQSAKLEKKH